MIELLSPAGSPEAVIAAVQNGKILDLPDNELSRPAPRLAEGAQKLFDFVYGEADAEAMTEADIAA